MEGIRWILAIVEKSGSVLHNSQRTDSKLVWENIVQYFAVQNLKMYIQTVY